MGNYNIPADYDGPAIPHRIRCHSNWEGCQGAHETAAQVRDCFGAKRDGAWPCSWLMEGRYDDGSRFTFECGAPTLYTGQDGSYECQAGHDFVPAQTRDREGWDYAGDDGEARLLATAGVQPVQMNGSAWAW